MGGFEHAKEATYPLQSSACCKHFVANEQEFNRRGVNSNVSQQDLVDSYLPSFQACVEEGAVSGIMCRSVRLHAHALACSHRNLTHPLLAPPPQLQLCKRRAVVRQRLAAQDAPPRVMAV